MIDWRSEQGQFILHCIEELKPTHSYPEIVDVLKQKHQIDLKLETLKSAAKRNLKTKLSDESAVAVLDDPLLTEEDDDFQSRIDVEKEKARSDKNKKLLNRLLAERAKTELIIDAIRESIVAFPKPDRVIPRSIQTCVDIEEALLLFSDAQIGEEIHSEDTNGFGEYNISIFQRRMDELTQQVRMIAEKQRHKIHRLNIFCLGDNVDGIGIYRGQEHHLDVLVIDQILIAAHQMSKNVIELLDTFETIKIWGIVGNHGRIGKKGEYPTTVNWDYILYKILEMLLVHYQDRIEWVIPKSNWCVADVCGHKFLLLHGDTIKGWGGLPYYGIDRADSRLKNMLATKGEYFRYMCLGHHHNPATIDAPAGEKILNGTMVGGSNFSINTLHTSSLPSQWYFGVSKEKGITWRYKILLT